jgi:regulator of protease activity HflC (stomatin/prohibitin superfamily)
MLDPLTVLLGTTGGLVGLGLLWDSFFVVRQKSSAIVERLGKFDSVRRAGFQLKVPVFDRVVTMQNLRIQQLDVDVETKTKDNVFVNTKVSVQFYIIEDRIRESFYKLDYPTHQIQSYVFDVIRSEIPRLDLDDVFANKDALGESIKAALTERMHEFGFAITNTLVTDLQPEGSVKDAMNRINATEREKVAAGNEAEAQKIKMVKIAEAEAESKKLQGVGLANQRLEIAKGIRESIETIKETGVDEDEVMTLLLVTQHYDAIQDVARNSGTNTVMMNYSPGGVGDVASQIREAMLSVKSGETSPTGGPAGNRGRPGVPPNANRAA